MIKKIKFSIIIPFKKPSKYLYECLDYIRKQVYTNYEVILLPDKTYSKSEAHLRSLRSLDPDGTVGMTKEIRVVPTGGVGPAEKRDIGAKISSGEILAFIDDDAYPDRDWLKNAVPHFSNPQITAVGGPGITPPRDDVFQQASGWVNQLWIGSGGAGTYRFCEQKKRYVDDYPSMNFFVRKDDFSAAGGFETHFWPGEDTKLCHDLIYILKKKIVYDPKILVYHHRKPLFLPHLRQISRYALHRGHFARVLPATSLRLGYLIPSFFVGFLIFGAVLTVFMTEIAASFYIIIFLYLILLTSNVIYVTFKTKSILLALFVGCGIVSTHVIYGLLFPVGFLRKNLRQ